MIKVIRVAVVMVAIFGMILCANGISWAQDDGSDVGDAGDAGGVVDSDTGGAADSDVGGSDTIENETVEYEEAGTKEQYKESAAIVSSTSSVTTTSRTHAYAPYIYVRDSGSSALVGAVIGAGVGAAVGSVAAGAGKSSESSDRTTKRPTVIKKKPFEKTAVQTDNTGPKK